MKVWALHLALIAALFAAQFLLSPYHTTNLARIMVLAVFAMGYNLAFGYTGLLSLGHALLLGAGMYAAGLSAQIWGFAAGPALIAGTAAGGVTAAARGLCGWIRITWARVVRTVPEWCGRGWPARRSRSVR